MSDDGGGTGRVRRAPPAFEPVVVRRIEDLSPHLRRLVLHGPGLAALDPGLPTSSVRLLVPPPGATAVEPPVWNGNEFLRPDGSRPVIRTYTLRALRPEVGELDVDVVLHPGGAVAAWAAAADVGSEAMVSGTGRGYDVDPAGRAWLVAGDETALPAISVLLEVLPPAAVVDVHVELARPDARIELPVHPGARVSWVPSLVEAVAGAPLGEGTYVWVAGEAAAVQRVRKLLEEGQVPRTHAWVRGYWKVTGASAAPAP